MQHLLNECSWVLCLPTTSRSIIDHALSSLFVPLFCSQFTFSGIQFFPNSDSGSMFPERLPFKGSFSLIFFFLGSQFKPLTLVLPRTDSKLCSRYRGVLLIRLNTETGSLQGKCSSERIFPSTEQLPK